ncbi:biotin-dependent carboxyltransferase family protein [Cohaesibacter celericrescens]|uniref:Allophanate hydrolase n=1 Tax=Cohaesibacter celericrescens TaxID=2067669 RepID=A0A2N5XVZ4_9HYPH|nr:biotin-dependent carboxyltransferase family protein [Cohaesibacter celericrescens]PLW78598.1 allophanate hydrolase [Cohaesibacter celericrescens]
MIKIVSTIGLSTVQDLGRDQNYRHGVSIGGAMDRLALALGNALLGNPEGAASIEATLYPFKIEFLSDMDCAVTGADSSADLDGQRLPTNWAFKAKQGQVLTLNRLVSGSFAYIALRGGIDVPEILGSRATHLRCTFGGYEGRMLKPGDILNADRPQQNARTLPEGGFGAESPQTALTAPKSLYHSDSGITLMRYLPAAEHPHFDDTSLKDLVQTPWQITPQSSRAGFRLSGPTLRLKETLEMRSHGIVPGVIQVPPGGAPIVQTADSQTSGGYPKIGTVIEPDLWRLAQTRIGSNIQFVETTYAEAIAAHREMQAYLANVRSLTETYRDFLQ